MSACVLLCDSGRTRSLGWSECRFPISDKEDGMVCCLQPDAMAVLASLGDMALFLTSTGMPELEEAWPAWAGLLLVNQACEI